MIIKFKRNNASGSSLPTSVKAGEPIWYKDILYVGSVGTGIGGSAAAGTPVKVATHVTGTETTTFPASPTLEGTITLSPSEAKRYLAVDGKEYKIQMPASDPYTSARTPASHNLNSHSDVSINSVAANNLLYYNGTNWVNGTFSTIFGGTPITSYNNQTIGYGSTTFGANDVVKLAAGTNISITADTTNKTLTIANTYSYTHPDRTETTSTSTASLDITSATASNRQITVKTYTFDGKGHETAVDTKTITIGQITAASLGLSGAMHFIGTSSTAITDGGTQNPTIGGSTVTTKASGDVVLYSSQEFIWNGTAWELLGDEGSYAVKSTTISATSPLSSTAKLDGTGSITHNTSGVTAASYGPSTDPSPAHSGTFSVPYITVDSYGHVTSAATKTVTLPAGYTHPSDGGNTGSFGPSTDASPSHGGTFSVPYITVNSSGHVTAASTKTITLPSDKDNFGTVYVQTGASTAAKTATVPWTYKLRTGNTFILYLKTTNSSTSATLNINSTGAKSVMINGAAPTGTNWAAGTYLCYYDGTYYQMYTAKNPYDYNDLINTPTIPTVPSNIVNTITTTAGAHTTISSATGSVSFKVPTNTSHLTNDSGFLTSHQGIKSLISSTSAQTSPTSAVAIAGSGNITLHKVAWTGTYSDLIGTPTIPSAASNGAFNVKAGSSGTAVQYGTANQSSATNMIFSDTATNGKFAVGGSSGAPEITLTEIDGGEF